MPFNDDFRFGNHRAVAHNLSLGPVEGLSIAVHDRSKSGGALRIDFDANPKVYSGADVAECQQRFLRLLTAIEAAPDRPIGETRHPGA